MNIVSRLTNSKFIRSGAIYSISSFIVSVIGYILNLIIARSFSLSDYGEYMSAISYLVLFGIPLSAFSMVVIKRIGRAKSGNKVKVALSIEKWLVKEFYKNLPLLLVILSSLGLLMFLKGNMALVSILFILLISIIGIFQGFYASVLQSYKNFLIAGLFMIAIFGVKMILTVGVILLNPTLPLLFVAFIVAGMFAIMYGHKQIKGKTNKINTSSVVTFKSIQSYLLKPAILVPLLTTFGIIGLANADVILVKKFFESDLAGLYGSLSLLGKIILYVSAPLSVVAFTFFTGTDSKHQSTKILLLLTLIIGGLGTCATLFYAIFPTFVVKVFFGSKFLGVSHLVWMAAVFGSLYSLMNLYAQYFVSQGSKFAYLGILAVALQTVGIYIFHSSLDQVLWINIAITGLLVLIYILEVIRREISYVKK